MAAGIELTGNGETIDLQQQGGAVAGAAGSFTAGALDRPGRRSAGSRCCASWCASWRWPERRFPGTGMAYGDAPVGREWRGERRTAQLSPGRSRRQADGSVGGDASGGPRTDPLRDPTSSRGWRCKRPWPWRMPATTSAISNLPAWQDMDAGPPDSAVAAAATSGRRFPATRWPFAPTLATRWAAITWTLWSSRTVVC